MDTLLQYFVDEDDMYKSPCVYGDIIAGHACYCANSKAKISKCPIWRNYGEDAEYWHPNGDWAEDNLWCGGCKYFVSSFVLPTDFCGASYILLELWHESKGTMVTVNDIGYVLATVDIAKDVLEFYKNDQTINAFIDDDGDLIIERY